MRGWLITAGVLVSTLAIAGCADRETSVSAVPELPAEPVSTVAASATSPAPRAPVAEPIEPRPLPSEVVSPPFNRWLADGAEERRIQILVHASRDGVPTTYGFRVDAEYVYPASAIKPFMAVAALASWRAQGEGPLPTSLRAPLQAMLRVSDNAAFARLYDFAGHEPLNRFLANAGFASVRVHHRMGETREQGLVMPAVVIRDTPNGDPLRLPARTSRFELPPATVDGLNVGRAHQSPGGKRLERAMSFAEKNYASLQDLQELMRRLVHPGDDSLAMPDADRALVVEAMSTFEPDAHRHKPLLKGVERVLERRHLRYVGKSGRAYGFHVANAYLENRESGRHAFVTAAIYANPNGVVNDDVYDYATTAAFMNDLGETVARWLLL